MWVCGELVWCVDLWVLLDRCVNCVPDFASRKCLWASVCVLMCVC